MASPVVGSAASEPNNNSKSLKSKPTDWEGNELPVSCVENDGIRVSLTSIMFNVCPRGKMQPPCFDSIDFVNRKQSECYGKAYAPPRMTNVRYLIDRPFELANGYSKKIYGHYVLFPGRNRSSTLREQLEAAQTNGYSAFVIQIEKLYEEKELMDTVVDFVRQSKLTIWILCPMFIPKDCIRNPWEAWFELRQRAQNSRSLKLALAISSDWNAWDLTDQLRSGPKIGCELKVRWQLLPEEIFRWFGETVTAIFVPRDLLFINEGSVSAIDFDKCYGHLSVTDFDQPAEISVWLRWVFTQFSNEHPLEVVFTGDYQYEKFGIDDPHVINYLYFRWLRRYEKERYSLKPWSRHHSAEQRSFNELILACQPLSQQIAVSTYDEWELDTGKFHYYRIAMENAFNHFVKIELMKPVVMILGCGQGPLLGRAILAAMLVRKALKLSYTEWSPVYYAVEKNYLAMPKLITRVEQYRRFGCNIKIFTGDMRQWQPPDGVKADLAVSELLGGFGCNELSPECLEYSAHLFHEKTICFPSSYTSYLLPLYSRQLADAVHDRAVKVFPFERTCEQWLAASEELAYKPYWNDYQPAFTFKHPQFGDPTDRLYKTITAQWDNAAMDCEVNGFSGNFVAYLDRFNEDGTVANSVEISTRPDNHSVRVDEWAPIWFPLNTPLPLKKGDSVKIEMKRCYGNRRVWYEWAAIAGHSPEEVVNGSIDGPFHNANGRHAWLLIDSNMEDDEIIPPDFAKPSKKKLASSEKKSSTKEKASNEKQASTVTVNKRASSIEQQK